MTLRSTTLADVVRKALDARVADLHVSLPGEILSFDTDTQLAEVRPLLKDSHEGEDGEEVVEPLPVIANVPVQFPGAGGYRLTFPIVPGTPCTLLFSDRALDLWLERGTLVDPVVASRHALTDGVALLGVRAVPQALDGFDSDVLALRHDDGTGVYVKPGELLLGAKDATDAAALASKVDDALGQLKTKLAAWVPVPGDGGAALKVLLTDLLLTWPSPVGSTTVKVKG